MQMGRFGNLIDGHAQVLGKFFIAFGFEKVQIIGDNFAARLSLSCRFSSWINETLTQIRAATPTGSKSECAGAPLRLPPRVLPVAVQISSSAENQIAVLIQISNHVRADGRSRAR